jgi:crotonobetaine/carnitine-CoA ligase
MKNYFLQNSSILDLLIKKSELNPKHILFIDKANKITRKKLLEKILETKGGLKKKGLKRGDRVVSLLDNSYEEILLFLACVTSGIIWIPLGENRKGVGLEYILKLTKPKMIFSKNILLKNLSNTIIQKVVRIEKNLKNLESKKCFSNNRDINKLSCIIFTSGTTGPPKGVMVTQKMLLAAAYGTKLAANVNRGDKFLLWESLYHIGGLEIIILTLFEEIHVFISKKFSAKNFWNLVRKYKINKLHYLGGILDILLKLKKNIYDKKQIIKLGFGAGARSDVVKEFKNRFNIKLREVYGMTEASSFTTINFNSKKKSIGKAVSWFNVKIFKKKSSDSFGEIIIKEKIKGLLTKGYYKNKKATKELIQKDGLHTGDLAKKDKEGNFFYIGRLKDSVRVRGENISAWEIETTLNKLAYISESAILKVEAEIGEYEILAFIIAKNNNFTINKIVKKCKNNFSKNYLPRYWCLINDFPRTPTLRVDKKKIKIRNHQFFDILNNNFIKFNI